jgi:uncharacterized protein (DUF433 family)
MLDWSHCAEVERIPGKVSGAWLCKGTRMPVAALFENLDSGADIEQFLQWFPGVTHEQVESVLAHTRCALEATPTQPSNATVTDDISSSSPN